MSFLGGRPDLAALLAEELDDVCDVLERTFLALEEGDRGGLDEALRAAHSLKGAASALGIRPLVRVGHELESVLGEVRQGRRAASPELVAVGLRAVDELRGLRPEIAAGSLSVSALGEVVAELRRPSATGDTDAASGGPGGSDPGSSDAPRSRATSGVRPAPVTDGSVVGNGGHDTVRVAVPRLQHLVAASGELLALQHQLAELASEVRLARSVTEHGPGHPEPGGRLATAPPADVTAEVRTRLRALDERLRGVTRSAARVITGLQDAALSMALLPLEESTHGLARSVRDAAASVGVAARLQVEAAGVEVDRRVVAVLRDPLLHLVRNAVAHGIEPAEPRVALGKPPTGLVRIDARREGGEVVVEVVDDGRGVDAAAVREAASAAGVDPEGADERELLFLAGLSTAERVSDQAGRGVGMDIVRRAIEGIGGTVRLHTTPDRGTRVVLRAPVTLSTMRVLLVTTGDQTVGVLAAAVERIVRLSADVSITVGDQPALRTDDGPIPTVALAGAFADGDAARDEVALIVAAGDGQAALTVERVIADREVLVEPLGPRLAGLSQALGTTTLPDGRRILVLHPVTLARARPGGAAHRAPVTDEPTAPPPRVLVVEDTATTRTLMRSLLEAAGYEALAVADGLEALRTLEERPVDLVVTDVEMPHMDGIELCASLRRSSRWQDLPVVIVTSHDAEEDRRRGLDAGADAYVAKGDFDRGELLRIVGGLL